MTELQVFPLRPSLFSGVPPYVQFIPVNGDTEFLVEPPEEMREMLWMVPTAPWYTISNCADLNGFTITEVRLPVSQQDCLLSPCDADLPTGPGSGRPGIHLARVRS